MTEGTASTERFERGTGEQSPGAGESSLSASVWGDKDVAERLTTMARSERTGLDLIMSGEAIIIPLLPGFPEIPTAPLKFVPKVSESASRAISVSDKPGDKPSDKPTESMSPRTAPVSDKPVETTDLRGDKRSLYSTADSTGRGVNQVEIDRVGIVRSFGFKDESGQRKVISGENLARLMEGGAVLGWKSARTGTGAESTTTITAPDGRTTYKVDALGRLISDVGTNQIAPIRGVLSVPTAVGTRYESAGLGGELRSASVEANGDFRNLTIRNGREDRQLVPADWAQLRPGGSTALGGLWWAARGDFGGSLPKDSIRLAHADGTAYYISPEGRLLHQTGPKESYRAPVGTLGDVVTRHTSPDRSHRGTNMVDVDDSGAVRALRFADKGGRTVSLPMATLSTLPADGVAVKRGEWQVSRTGSGDRSETTVVAPDGKTTYRLDSKGRLIPGHRN